MASLDLIPQRTCRRDSSPFRHAISSVVVSMRPRGPERAGSICLRCASPPILSAGPSAEARDFRQHRLLHQRVGFAAPRRPRADRDRRRCEHARQAADDPRRSRTPSVRRILSCKRTLQEFSAARAGTPRPHRRLPGGSRHNHQRIARRISVVLVSKATGSQILLRRSTSREAVGIDRRPACSPPHEHELHAPGVVSGGIEVFRPGFFDRHFRTGRAGVRS